MEQRKAVAESEYRMIAQPTLQRLSVDEWRELERTTHDVKHEYIDGRVCNVNDSNRCINLG